MNHDEEQNTNRVNQQPLTEALKPVESVNTGTEDTEYRPEEGLSPQAWRNLKICLVVGGIVGNIIMRFGLPTDSVECIRDKTHELFHGFNHYLNQSPNASYNLKVFFNVMVDANLLIYVVHWIFFSSSWKLIFDLLLFFSFRFICTHIIAYKHPEGIVWPDTAIYSISNTSLNENQYQVSAYTGILVLAILYWLQEEKKFMTIVASISLAFSMLLELSFRISYCTDIFAAIITAHLFSSLNKVWCGKLDRAILNIITGYWERKAPKSASISKSSVDGPAIPQAAAPAQNQDSEGRRNYVPTV